METVSLVTEDLMAALQHGKERCEEAKMELERQHQLLQWLVGKYSFQDLNSDVSACNIPCEDGFFQLNF